MMRAFWQLPVAPIPIISLILLLSHHLRCAQASAAAPHASVGGALLAARACTRAARLDPNVKAPFCASALKETWLATSASGPGGIKRKVRRPFPQTLSGVVELSVFAALGNATHSTAAIRRMLLPGGKVALSGDRLARECVEDCLQIYSDAADGLRDSIRAVRDGRLDDASSWISAALDAPGTCDDGFMELASRRKGRTRKWNPLRKNSKDLFQLSAMSLTFVSFLRS